MKTGVQKILEKYGKDKTRLMDILIDVQSELGFIPRESTVQIADDLVEDNKYIFEIRRALLPDLFQGPLGILQSDPGIVREMFGRDFRIGNGSVQTGKERISRFSVIGIRSSAACHEREDQQDGEWVFHRGRIYLDSL